MSAPAESAEMRTLRQLSEAPYRLLSHGRLRRACNDGTLHGHQRGERKQWQVAEVVALAWQAGADRKEQKRICPMCHLLALIPKQGRGGLRVVGGTS